MGETKHATAEEACRRRLVVFDFDGTLADTKGSIVRVATGVLREMGVAEERLVDVPQLVGPPFPQAFMMVFGMSREEADEATARYRAIYNHMGVEAWPAFTGIPQLVRDLRASGRLTAVASSKSQRMLEKVVGDNGMLANFDAVVGRDVERETTKAQAIAGALARLGVGPADAVMVGDRCYDVEGAGECGVPCLGVTYGGTAPASELWDSGAVAVAGSVDELRAMLLG